MGRVKKAADPVGSGLTFKDLVRSIQGVDAELATQARRAVNVSLTLRNFLIGCYIAEYELRGQDRAAYGENLLDLLAKELGHQSVSNSNRRQLYRYLRFYRTYPAIVGTLSPQFRTLLPPTIRSAKPKKVGTLFPQSNVGTLSPQSEVPAESLLNRLSYSHLELLVDLDDDAKRDFYTGECMRGNWSVRGLKRQIASLYFERPELSLDKAKLAELVQAGAVPANPRLEVRDP